MFHELPQGHNIPDGLVRKPLFHFDEGNNVALTKAQVSGIDAGVARGESILLVAPTSSGKTEIGLIGAATWLLSGDGISEQVIFLVTHRALARQKFKELSAQKYLEIFGLGQDEIVLSTGDETVDGQGSSPDDPLAARFLIATYEKYLALLAGSGHRKDMNNVCVVADELQILGDEYRGRSVEVLLTIVRTAGYGQFIGLSAVLSQHDREAISQWMNVNLVAEDMREVPLTFELRGPETNIEWSTDGPDEINVIDGSRSQAAIDILNELSADEDAHFPVAVFCMTKSRISELSRAWASQHSSEEPDQELRFEEPTASAAVLASSLPNGFGIHTADLIDVERVIVEDKLEQDLLPVVFATTTLAQGLNFSFRTVIFDQWVRWNSDQRTHIPIPYSDFHNIAGRAGRLGKQDRGRVYLSAGSTGHLNAASRRYFTREQPELNLGQIDPTDFDATALQLISAGLATNRNELFEFLSESLTGFLSRDKIKDAEANWLSVLDETIQRLRDWELIQ